MFPGLPVSGPAFAMVGMGAMVGGGTGAALTAITMVFEMTRDYNIVLPMVLAVAVALGVRRMLSRENIYTMKLVRRGHPVPSALHTNMFLVCSAADVMDKEFLLIDECVTFADFLRLTAGSTGLRHIVVTRGKIIVGVLRVNTGLRQTVSTEGAGVLMGALAQRNFTIVRKDSAIFDVIARLRRHDAIMGVVVDGPRHPRAADVIGVITKEHIADEVANSARVYSR